ncbi:CRTAC1 family protein [Lutimonas zeaxanthinifaciens]|uniref:CRTAC1 family protein n=1 Tax=Lutimonas zeaxanthinifaciens TaxID=3060215 RepID=UPI00265D35C2|nr:CRTAC1 family protein [Lutimonas sp. YSD2104]WKK66676.1 CRTAC1 family protein [Lutimonas sp. YSD2104]
MKNRSFYFFIVALFTSPLLILAQSNVVFKDISKSSGFDFRYTFGDTHYENILESSGSGITVFDYNNDGFYDIYMMNGTYLEGISDSDGEGFRNSRDKFYRNNGDGSFSEIGEEAGLNDLQWSMAAGAIDLDEDGFQDLFLLNYGSNVFYRNNGDGTFNDITEKLGLAGPETLNGFTKWSIGVSYWDYNKDGLLDAMVGNFLAFDPEYVSTQTPGMMPHPSEYKGQPTILYEQKKDGSFIDVSKENNLYYPDSKCMGLTVADLDHDGDLDIFQANDHHYNFLFRNDDGIYKEVGIASGVAANSKGQETGSMHATLGDIDGDGLIDIFVSDLKYGSLYRNTGNGFYEDITEKSGVAASMAGKGGWGAALFDYDNDGDLDLITANGTAEELILQYPLLMENDGSGNFKDVGKAHGAYFNDKRSGRGLVVWDFDNDGDLDITVSHVDLKASASMLENQGGNINNWLGITLTGSHGLSSGIGALVHVKSGGKSQTLVNQWTTGYLSNKDPRLHVGLGKNAKIDEIKIHWPDGFTEVIKEVPVNQYINIVEGKGILK